MPVSYFQQAAHPTPFHFFKICFTNWRGSFIKLIGIELAIFIFFYYILAFSYTFFMTDFIKKKFESIVRNMVLSLKLVRVSFMLNIFLSLVYQRFVRYYNYLPWNAKACHLIGTYWPSQDPYQRLLRRTIDRYFQISFIMALSRLSLQIKKLYPSLQSMEDQGILTVYEREEIEKVSHDHSRPFLPLSWALSIISKAFQSNEITSENGYVTIVKQICTFQRSIVTLFITDYINYSLVYVQVASLSVYAYIIGSLFGAQNIPDIDRVEHFSTYATLLPPILSIVEIAVFLGLNKLAISLQNPLGLDDDDFDVIEVLDFNKEMGRLFNDGKEFAEDINVGPDMYSDTLSIFLPHTKKSLSIMSRCGNYLGSQWTKSEQIREKMKFQESKTTSVESRD